MKKLLCILGLLIVVSMHCKKDNNPVSNDDDNTTGEGSIVFEATRVDDLHGPAKPAASLSTNVTPSTYTLALVNYWLTKSGGTDVSIINPVPASPVYTAASPLIVDFHDSLSTSTLHSGTTFQAGTYTGYKMEFIYIEMTLPVVFHVPHKSWETDYADTSIFDTQIERRFRLYFDANGPYWKRDFVVELDPGTDVWYWMRRVVEDTSAYRNFFIAVASNPHPPGGAAPESTIDLFDDLAFWGPASGYGTSSPIIVGTHSTVGGLDCRMSGSFTIPTKLASLYTVILEVDITNTMNFWETGIAPAGISFTSGVLDLGPGYEGSGTPENYGDIGLHPFLPIFNMTAQFAGP